MTAPSPRAVFDPKVIAALITAGLVAFGLFMVLLAHQGDIGSRRDGRGHALSESAVGFKGLVRLIELGGGHARLIRSETDHDSEDLLVVVAEPETQADALEDVLRRRGMRPTLIVLPKWQVVPDAKHRGWVKRIGTLPPVAFATILGTDQGFKVASKPGQARLASGHNFLERFRAPLPDTLQTISGGEITPFLVGRPDEIVLAKLGGGPHYLLADPDLLNNQALKDPARAKAALDLLSELNSTGARTVGFDLTVNGLGQPPNALKLAFEPPFLPLTIALVLAAILAGLHGAFRFGPAAQEARAIAFGKRALVENSASLLKIARREQSAGPAYAELIREAAAHDSGAHLALRDAELDAYLDRLSLPDRPTFSELARTARLAEDRNGLVAAARALFQWKKDLIK